MPNKNKKWVALSDAIHISILALTAAKYYCHRKNKQHGPLDVQEYKADFELLGTIAALVVHYRDDGLLNSPTWKKFDFDDTGRLYSYLSKEYRRITLSCPFLKNRSDDLTDFILSPTENASNLEGLLVLVLEDDVIGYRPCGDVKFGPCKSPFEQCQNGKISKPIRSTKGPIPYPAAYDDLKSLLKSRAFQGDAEQWMKRFRKEVKNRKGGANSEPTVKDRKPAPSTVTSAPVGAPPGSGKGKPSRFASASVADPSGIDKTASKKAVQQAAFSTREDQNEPQVPGDLGYRESVSQADDRHARVVSEVLRDALKTVTTVLDKYEEGCKDTHKSLQKAAPRSQTEGMASGVGASRKVAFKDESGDELESEDSEGSFPDVHDLSDPGMTEDDDEKEEEKDQEETKKKIGKKKEEERKKMEERKKKEEEMPKKKKKEEMPKKKKEEEMPKKKKKEEMPKKKKKPLDEDDELDRRLEALKKH